MNTPMKPMHFICGNIVFSVFSKFLSHMSHIFLRKLIKVTFSAIFQYEQCYNTLLIENSENEQKLYCCLHNLTYIHKTLFYYKWVMLDAFMHNLHCSSYILTPKIQFLPPKVIVAFSYFFCLIVLWRLQFYPWIYITKHR